MFVVIECSLHSEFFRCIDVSKLSCSLRLLYFLAEKMPSQIHHITKWTRQI
jgi:hypothetical protein